MGCDRGFINMSDIQVGGLPLRAPPINNACLPTIYNKLDADVQERNRVKNRFLEHRLKFQEKMIEKYRLQALRIHYSERDKLRKDVKRIVQRLPNLVDMPYLETKLQDRTDFHQKSEKKSKYKGYTTEPKELNGIPAEKDNKPFCDRFYFHHLPTKTRFTRGKLPPLGSRSFEAEHAFHTPLSRGLLLSQRLSASDNFLASRGTQVHSRPDTFELPLDIDGVRVVRDDDAITI